MVSGERATSPLRPSASEEVPLGIPLSINGEGETRPGSSMVDELSRILTMIIGATSASETRPKGPTGREPGAMARRKVRLSPGWTKSNVQTVPQDTGDIFDISHVTHGAPALSFRQEDNSLIIRDGCLYFVIARLGLVTEACRRHASR